MNPLESTTTLSLQPLPDTAIMVLQHYAASPRLLAHLRLVHDVAAQLCTQLHARSLLTSVDQKVVLFGAATHDIGKVDFPAELSDAGSFHEQRGSALLLAHNISHSYARFAQTHGSWRSTPDLALEDLLVALADTCWKGKRDEELEQRIAAVLTHNLRRDFWEVWLTLDSIIEEIATDADRRLFWQAQFPIS